VARNVIYRVNRNLARRLSEARQERGLSTREVCDLLRELMPDDAVSHATLASYERGDTSPSIPVLTVIAEVYKRPVEWFLGTIDASEVLTGFRYRNLKSRVRLGDQRQFEASASKWVDAYVRLEERLGVRLKAKHRFPPVDASTKPTDLARLLRQQLGLTDNDPIPDTVEILESLGVRTMELSTVLDIDGMAARRGESFVVVLKSGVSPDRLRLNALHELAHVLYDDCKNQNGWSDDLVEKRAYEFGSALLLPDSQLREAFDGSSFVKLMKCKEKFGISIAAMIFRAERQKVILSTTARNLWIRMNQKGWRKKEPGEVWRDRADRFEVLLESAIQTHKLTWDDAERVTGVCQTDLQKRLNDALRIDGEEVSAESESCDVVSETDE
jgi:Zn-dependent peptidase ImmA (M78 family)/transcriptional regulator with XRE-family HTH domain